MVKRVLDLIKRTNFLSQGGHSSQNYVLLVKFDPSGAFLDVQN